MDTIDVTILVKECVYLILKCASPLVGAALLVGIVVSLLQVLTQVQEMTLTFLPKFIATMILFVVLMPWMSHQIGDFFKKNLDFMITLSTRR